MRCAGGPHWHVIVATLCVNPWSAAFAHTLGVECSRWHGGSWVWESGAITCCAVTVLSASASASAVPPTEVLQGGRFITRRA